MSTKTFGHVVYNHYSYNNIVATCIIHLQYTALALPEIVYSLCASLLLYRCCNKAVLGI